MATEIGPVTAKLTASAEGVKAGADAAANYLRTGADKMKSGLSWVKDSLELAYTKPLTALATGIIPAFASAVGKIPGVGGVAALGLEGIGSGLAFLDGQFQKGKESILELGKNAAMAGSSVQDFQVVSRAFGGDETASRAIFKYQNNLAEAAISADGAGNAFSRLGLSAKSLVSLPITEQMVQVSNAIKKIEEPALRAKAAMDLMGKQGYALMPSLMKGGDWIEKQKGFVDKFGLGVSDADFANVRAAEAAGKQVKMFWDGLTNQITVGVAPVLAELSETIGGIPLSWKGVSDLIVGGAENISLGVAYVGAAFTQWGDTWKWLQGAWKQTTAVMVELMASLVGAAGQAAQAIGNMFGREWGKGALDLADTMQEAAAIRWNQGADLVRQGLDGWNQNAAVQKVTEFFERVKERRTQAMKDAGDSLNLLLPRVEALGKAIESPALKFKETFQEVLALQNAFIAKGTTLATVAPGLAELTAAKAFESLRSAYGGGGSYAPSAAIVRGSREDYSTTQAFRFSARESVQEEMRRLLEEANRKQEIQIQLGREAIEAYKANPPVAVRGIN